MLIPIDSTKQLINTDRIESIMLNFGGQTYKVTMFSGHIIYIKPEVKELIDETQEIHG